MNLHQTQVELNVFDWNIGAIKCYEKVGFIINQDRNLQRKVKNEMWTAINMRMNKEDWHEYQTKKKLKKLKRDM